MTGIDTREYENLLLLYKHPFRLIRLGRNRDGGYVVPKELISDSLLTCGINDEVSFEEDYIKNVNNCKVHAFDGTVDNFPVDLKDTELNFHKINIGPNDTDKEISIQTIVDRYFGESHNIFLKMDIEGSEYSSFDTISEDYLKRFSCIVLEVHWIDREYKKFERLLRKLLADFVLIHKHDNNCGKYFMYNGKVVPDVYELTFVRKELIKTIELSDQKVHIDGLDYPNSSASRDIIPDV